MDLNPEAAYPSATTRRNALATGGKLAAIAALFAASPGILSTAARKKKKKRKKKSVPLTPQQPAPLPSPFQEIKFKAENMTGENQVAPDPEGDPAAVASATFRIVAANRICGTFHFTTTPASPVILTHIHFGNETVGGGEVVVDFAPVALDSEVCETVVATDLDTIKANPANFYANIHTVAFDKGAARAQLQADPG